MKNKFTSIFRLLVLMAMLLCLADQGAAQTPGSLDATFGNAGLALIPPNDNSGIYEDMTVQPDGKIVTIGNISTVNGQPFANVARLTVDGKPDPTFDSDGFVFSNLIRITRVVKVQPDGKILVGGNLDLSGSQGFVRLNNDGSPDTTLNGNGQVVTMLGTGFNVTSINVQTDGKIIVAGTTALTAGSQDFGVLRYNANGTLDPTFGTGGRVATDISGSDAAFDGVVQSDGKILVIGHSTDISSNTRSATLVRYNSDGALDTTFGSGGKLIRTGGTNTSALKIAVQSDGRIIIVGNGILPLRFNPNGTLETTFQGVNGFLYSGIAIQPNGKIVISGGDGAGGGNYNFSVLRYNSDGMLDTTFAHGRVITTTAGGFAEDVVIQPNGKIVAAGTRYDSETKIVLARYIAESSNHRALYDFDGDGKADVSVFRQSTGAWYLLNSTAGFTGSVFGQSGDKIVPADYDGDGKTDLAVFRSGNWYIQRSTGGFYSTQFGTSNHIPAPADFTGDGRADIAVFIPASGAWFVFDIQTNQTTSFQFGQSGDAPVAADYDGDGRADYAVFRTNTWYIQRSTQGFFGIQFGQSGDQAVPADYDGDGKTDVAVFRPSNGAWYINRSAQGFFGTTFGQSGDLPVPADYDGDGKADIAVYRTNAWYLNRSTQGFTGVQFGSSGDLPAPNAFVR